MPTQRRALRVLPVLLGALTALVLAACTVPAVPARVPVLARPAAHAAPATAEVVRVAGETIDDPETGVLLVVPARRNGALAVFAHGWAHTRWAMLQTRKRGDIASALVGAGYTVLSVDARLQAWGDRPSVADYRRAIRSTRERYDLHDVFLMGESMGGLATMQLAATVPGVRAVTAWYPVCDLSTMTAPRFRASIDAAWSLTDRRAVSPVPVSDRPLMIWASEGDTVVDTRRNAAVCAAAARDAGADVTMVRTAGDHGDASNFVPHAVLGFFEAHRTAR